MTHREHFNRIMNRQADRSGFWHGCPNPASVDNLFDKFQVKDDFELGLKLGSSCRWIQADAWNMYRQPDSTA